MRRVALATLRHDAARAVLLVLGLGVSWALVAVQLGLSRGFELSSRAILDHVGGEVWIAAEGVRVVDDGEPLTQAAFEAAWPGCAARPARPLVVDYTQARRADRSLVTAQVVGADARSRGRVPWSIERGDAASLEANDAVGVDAADAEKLGLPADPMGAELELRGGSGPDAPGARLRITVVTRGARSFTQTPYLFMGIATARRVLALPDDAATFWVLDGADAACTGDDVAGARALPREALAESTRAHWVGGSGIGTLLTIGSLMAAVVGAAALLLSTATLVRTYTREIATVRALGASRRELASFVAWQVGVVSLAATALALGLSMALSAALRGTGLVVVIDPATWLAGVAVAGTSTLVASVLGARVLGRLDPREVLE